MKEEYTYSTADYYPGHTPVRASEEKFGIREVLFLAFLFFFILLPMSAVFLKMIGVIE